MQDRAVPGFIDPMLLSAGRQVPEGPHWLAQVKVDGARGQLRVAGGVPSLRTRHGRRCDTEFPEIISAATELPATILDGEVTILADDGAPDFAALRGRLGRSAAGSRLAAAARPATFYAFDVLWHNGIDLRDRPLAKRLEVLESLGLGGGALVAVDTFPGKAAQVLEFARAHELEGCVAKRADSPYRSGRATTWLKFKLRRPERYWVTAWIPGGPGELDRYWVGRVVDGALTPTGEVAYGLKPGQATALRRILRDASLGARQRNGLIPVAPVVAMTVESHGRTGGWLRDPIITNIDIDPRGPIS
jgi:bifunctional non-homologous end joining protein LigD